MPISDPKLLLFWYWTFWIGTVLIPIFVNLIIEMGPAVLLLFFFPSALCFSSAYCVPTFPRLAKFGIASLTVIVLILALEAFIFAQK